MDRIAAIEKLAPLSLHNPFIRRAYEVLRSGEDTTEILCQTIIALACANDELRKSLIEFHMNTTRPAFPPKVDPWLT